MAYFTYSNPQSKIQNLKSKIQNPIAIVGMACEYPDARSPQQLWENTLAQRRAFRQMPPERLSLEDYFSADKATADCTYGTQAALIEGYDFDRVGFRVVGSTFRNSRGNAGVRCPLCGIYSR